MGSEKQGSYRERKAKDPSAPKTKTIGFVPAPDMDEVIRDLAANQNVTVSRAVDMLIRAGFEARRFADQAKILARIEDKLSHSVDRLSALAWTQDEVESHDPTEADKKAETAFVARLMSGNPSGYALALMLGAKAFSDPFCNAVIHHIEQQTFRPALQNPRDNLKALMPLLKNSHHELFGGEDPEKQEAREAEFMEQITPYLKEGGAVAHEELLAARLFIRATRRLGLYGPGLNRWIDPAAR